MDDAEAPTSKRWIWITGAVVGFFGFFSWWDLRDGEWLPDDDLIRERAVFNEEENGYGMVLGLEENAAFEYEDAEWIMDE